MKSDLPDAIAGQLHCFISDLRQDSRLSLYKGMLHDFPFEEYSLEDCNYTLSYMFGKELQFSSYEEIRRYLDSAG